MSTIPICSHCNTPNEYAEPPKGIYTCYGCRQQTGFREPQVLKLDIVCDLETSFDEIVETCGSELVLDLNRAFLKILDHMYVLTARSERLTFVSVQLQGRNHSS